MQFHQNYWPTQILEKGLTNSDSALYTNKDETIQISYDHK